jgi:SAM-dependent methyltransferase
MLERDPKARVLDLGCGDGELTARVAAAVGTKEVYGVDVNEESLEKAKARGIITVKHDLNKFPYPFETNTFDVVVSNQVIEHLYYPIRFLREVYRILKPGGYAIISTENLASWDNIIALLLGYTPFSMEFDEGLVKLGNPLSPHNREVRAGYTHPHVRIFTYKGLIEAIKTVGFKVEKVAGAGHIIPIRILENSMQYTLGS